MVNCGERSKPQIRKSLVSFNSNSNLGGTGGLDRKLFIENHPTGSAAESDFLAIF